LRRDFMVMAIGPLHVGRAGVDVVASADVTPIAIRGERRRLRVRRVRVVEPGRMAGREGVSREIAPKGAARWPRQLRHCEVARQTHASASERRTRFRPASAKATAGPPKRAKAGEFP
jgi:hypothetical protein